MKKWTPCHLHTQHSNSILTDSPCSHNDYIKYAKDNEFNGLIFTEHGNALSWYSKKKDLEKNGFKYVHAVEGYVSNSIEDKTSYHICLYGLNNDGRKEINKLISTAYKRDGNFYRRPRMMIENIVKCNNIAIATACLGGIFKDDNDIFGKLVEWELNNKGRLFLEIQPHNNEDQINLNNKLIGLSKEYNLPLIASNDIHYIDDDGRNLRSTMQKAKKMDFGTEDSFDQSMKSYDDMVKSFLECGVDIDIAEQSLDNTNVLYSMADDYKVDDSFKYPHMYDNATEVLTKRCIEEFVKRGYSGNDVYANRLIEELDTIKILGAESYMLLFSDWIRGIKKDGINVGISRGSCSGGLVTFLLDITSIDPIMWGTSFFRFLNPQRITLSDIDIDIEPSRRNEAKMWFYGRDGLNCSEILTLGGEKYKGATDYILRSLKIEQSEIDSISSRLKSAFNSEENSRVQKGLMNADSLFLNNMSDEEFDEFMKNREIEDLKEYAYKIKNLEGCVTKIGSHPAGVLVSDLDIESEVGIITIVNSKKETVSVSQLNMKELESLGYVKADALGLANIGVINRTYNYIGIDRPTPQEINFEDNLVWDNIKKSPVGIFQFEKVSSHRMLVDALNNIEGAKRIFTMSACSGIIRPSGDSIREQYLKGEKYDNGHESINKFFEDNGSFVIYQEDIMNFLTEFCGYNGSESDEVRRAIGKKLNTNSLLPEIERRFIENFSSKYDVSVDKCKDIISNFLDVVESASRYGFSLNHSIAYSQTGYICGWLRTYYEKEFITANLNEFKDKKEKMKEIYNYINEHTNIKVLPPKYGKASMEYRYDKDEDVIYEGLFGAKGLSKNCSDELDKLYKMDIDNFTDLLIKIKQCGLKLKSSDIGILIDIDFFNEFGGQRYLNNLNTAILSSGSKIKYDAKSNETKTRNIKALIPNLSNIETIHDNILDLIFYIKDNGIKISKKDLDLMVEFEIIKSDCLDIDKIINLLFASKSSIKYTSVKTESTRIKKQEIIVNAISNMYDYNKEIIIDVDNINIDHMLNKNIYNYSNSIVDEDESEIIKAINELKILGHTDRILRNLENDILFMLSVDKFFSNYKLNTFSLKTGEIKVYDVKKANMIDGLSSDDIIMVNESSEDIKWRKTETGYEDTGLKKSVIKSMSIVNLDK